MSVKIDRDLGGFNAYKVTVNEPGFGKLGPVVGLSIDEAIETARHYYAREHNTELCGFCQKKGRNN